MPQDFFDYSRMYNMSLPPLSEDDESDLFTRYNNELDQITKDKIKDKIAKHNIRLVLHITKQYDGDKNEIFACGMLGLSCAIDAYQSHRGKFANCAITHIKKYILEMLNNNSLIHIPRSAKEKHKNNKHDDELIHNNKTAVSAMNALNISSLDQTTIDGDPLMNTIQDSYNSTEESESDIHNKTILNIAINSLTDVEQNVIRMIYGINEKILHKEEIAKIFNISAERVRQIEKKAQESLRKQLKNKI